MKTLLLFLLLSLPISLHAQTVDVLPVRVSEGAQSLNGVWKFKYLPALNAAGDENFVQPSFDVAAWKTIAVPSHWELQGFAEPQYGDDVKEGTGLYRRTFRVPKTWQGQRVFLRFDGVLYGFTAFVNGKPVGEWASGYNAATFDITDALRGDADNVLAVRVTTRSKGWDFDAMDCWALSGIYRDVTLFALPQLHLEDYTSRTTLKADGTAELQLDFKATAAARLAGQLLSPEGKAAQSFNLTLAADGRGVATLTIKQPRLWTAETPALYRLEVKLASGGKTVQSYTDRIGLRQVTIENGLLKLNGVPIKLRGVDHHQIWPEGRVATEEKLRRDLELIRAANINFVRTSHYPPHPRLPELCDEMGIYLLDEVPFIHGRKNLSNPDYQDAIFKRARATVMRDKNRPSVLFWSLGNENPVTLLGTEAGKAVKQLDPTRPIMFPMVGSYFRENYQQVPDFADIYAPHYPNVKRASDYAEQLTRPIIFTEYAHQRGLARSGAGVQDMWEVFYRSPRITGGAIWLFQDQGILRTAAEMKSVKNHDLMVWLDEHRYYDTNGYFGVDGLVYSDRTPQTDYWQVRKVYSPVRIPEEELTIKPGAQKLALRVENRFDFIALTGFRLKWALLKNGASLQSGVIQLTARPKETQTVPVDVALPTNLSTDVFALELRCEDAKGQQFYERSIRLATGAASDARWRELLSAQPASAPKLEVSDAIISVKHQRYELKLNRQTGQLALLNKDGAVLVSAFGPRVGRKPIITDIGKTRDGEPAFWQGNLMREVTALKTDVQQIPEGVQLTVSGNYSRPGKPEEFISGEYKVLVTNSGAIEVSYSYKPVQATGETLDAGFALAVPSAQSEFRWIGQGPYAGYPGNDRLNEYGVFHLNRADLYFPGNRRGVELAATTAQSGAGILLSGNAMTLDVERADDTTLFSHLALVPGQSPSSKSVGEEVAISSKLKVQSIKTIAGSFKLLPLDTNWRAPLSQWFGAPSEKAVVRKAYYRSYDQ